MSMKLTLHSGEKVAKRFDLKARHFPLSPRAEIAPGQWVGAIPATTEGRALDGFRWGLEPNWWDAERHAGHRLFTARAETLAQKPAWAESLEKRRCVVPADGFWMWHEIEGEKRPFLVRARNGDPFALAAIWEENSGEKQLALVTTETNRLLSPLGARMPAILKPGADNLWLDSAVINPRVLTRVLTPPSSRELEIVPTVANARSFEALRPAPEAREALTWLHGPDFRPEKPRFAPLKRLVRRDHAIGGQVFFQTRSFTADDATRWHPVVDVEEGRVYCDCPDFHYRHAHHEPDVWTPQWWCKHVARAVANCRRKGELPSRQQVFAEMV